MSSATCPHCAQGEILDPHGRTIRICTCLMGILQLCLYIADTGGDSSLEVFGVLGGRDAKELALC